MGRRLQHRPWGLTGTAAPVTLAHCDVHGAESGQLVYKVLAASPAGQENMTKPIFTTLAIALTALAFAGPAVAQASRPDTDFCAKMRAKDPGGICNSRGEYVTADKVYLPDGKVVPRSTGG
jgi:hypothetical protein